MKGVVLERYGLSVNLLYKEDLKEPVIGPNQVLVNVFFAGVNPADSKIRSGNVVYIQPVKLPAILGFEFSGVIKQVGLSVTKFKEGDEVFGRCDRMGAYAELISVDENDIALKPKSTPMSVAAAAGVGALTAIEALKGLSNLKQGQKVFIIGGAGGIGSYSIQLAKQLGCYVAANCSSKNVDWLKSLGADLVIDYTSQDFSRELKGQNYDVVMDCVGGDEFYYKSLEILSPKGNFVTIVGPLMYAGSTPATIGLMLKMAYIIGKHKIGTLILGGPSYNIVAKLDNSKLDFVAEMFEKGVVPKVETIFPLEKANEAHDQIDTHHTRGKVVLQVNS